MNLLEVKYLGSKINYFPRGKSGIELYSSINKTYQIIQIRVQYLLRKEFSVNFNKVVTSNISGERTMKQLFEYK